MGSEDDFLERLHPFLGTGNAVCLDMVHSLAGHDGKFFTVYAFVFMLRSRDAVSQIDVATREVKIRGVGIVGQYVSL